MVYSSPSLGATTTPNGSAVSNSAQNKVGLEQNRLTTSDIPTVSKENISQTGEKSNSQPKNVTKKVIKVLIDK